MSSAPDAPTRGSERAAPPRVTLKEVARRAGVHFTTVSLALRNHPGLPAATRERITAIALELGYRRDPVLMALTARRLNVPGPGRVRRIAFLTDQPSETSFARTPHMRFFYEGARQQAERLGYRCDRIFVHGPEDTPADLLRQLREREYDGIIIGAFYLPHERLQLDWDRYSVVKIDTRFLQPNATLVANDQLGAVRLAFRRLRELGYRRIGMAVGVYDELATSDRYAAGFLIEQTSVPPEDRVPILHFDYHDHVREAVPKLRAWAIRHRPQVCMCNWSSVVSMAQATGLRVPQELACVGLCLNDPTPQLAGVIQNHRAVGRRAAEMLALAAKAGVRGIGSRPTEIYIGGCWQDGATAPRRA